MNLLNNFVIIWERNYRCGCVQMGVMLLFIGGSVDIEIMVASCFSRCNHLGCNVAHPQDADLQLAWGACPYAA